MSPYVIPCFLVAGFSAAYGVQWQSLMLVLVAPYVPDAFTFGVVMLLHVVHSMFGLYRKGVKS